MSVPPLLVNMDSVRVRSMNILVVVLQDMLEFIVKIVNSI